jgi:hypothetical protein
MPADEDDKDTADAPWGEGPDVPPLSDVKDPLAKDEDGDGDDDDTRDWVPPIP